VRLSFPNREVKFGIVVTICAAAGKELSEVKRSSRIWLNPATPRSSSSGNEAFAAADVESLRSARIEFFIVSIVSSVTCCSPLESETPREDKPGRFPLPSRRLQPYRPTHGALHPDREPLETLDRIRRTIGEYNFAGQYQQSPAPLGGGLVKAEWFKRYRESERPERFDRIAQSWDTANKVTELSDSRCVRLGV
jgi:hypothetical protein